LFQNKFLTVLIFCLIPFFDSCRCAKEKVPPKNFRPTVSADGIKITFHPESPGMKQIQVSKFDKSSDFISIGAPARIIASVASSSSGRGRIVLFESADINTLYAQYLQSRNALNRTSKNLQRIKDMYQNQVATLKDMIEVETEYGNAQAEFAETEGKLRAMGFNPVELGTIRANTVLLISDIPEGNLGAVAKGKSVKIVFTSFPDQKFTGVAAAVGDNVDPLTRTVKVRVAMQNYQNKFKPGMYAHIEFSEKSSSGAVIPFSSVVTVEGNTYIFVQKDPGEFERRQIVLGNSGIDKVGVIKGLEFGEEIVVQGTLLLKGLSFGY